MNAPAATAWQTSWLTTSATQRGMAAWRGVEAQHVVSTLRLVDSLAEQAELERLLEGSKPALPVDPQGPRARAPGAAPQHYLLSTPFRYRPVHGSRFRKPGTQGLWYGAASLQTAAAEVAFWRWRFLMDSAALMQQALHTEHTFFEAQVQGNAIDLCQPPWAAHQAAWGHPSDYGATQALAQAAAQHAAQWIAYASVRDPGGVCAAVLSAQALSVASPMPQQTWHCKTTRSTVLLVHGQDRFSWGF